MLLQAEHWKKPVRGSGMTGEMRITMPRTDTSWSTSVDGKGPGRVSGVVERERMAEGWWGVRIKEPCFEN